jgi:predicted MFS family arabinose efflux permease
MGARSRLAAAWLTLFVVGTDLFVVSPLLPSIAGEFRLSPALAGCCATAFALTYMIAAPFLGGLADRVGRRRILCFCLSGFALANLLSGTAAGFAWLISWRVAAGAAAAGVTPLVYAAVGEAAPPERRATWMALAVSGLLLALSVGAPIGALVGAAWGWRAPFLGLAGASLALAAVNRIVWPSGAPTGPRATATAMRSGAPLALRLTPTVLWATALYGMYTYLGLGLVAAGFSPPQVARSISLYGLAALAGALLGGHAADRIGTRKTMLVSLTGLAACLGVLGGALHSEWSVDALVMLTSAFAQLFFPAQQAALAVEFSERRATALACNNSALFLGISLGALFGGQAMSRAGFATVTTLAAEFACAGFVVIVLTRHRQSVTKKPSNTVISDR